jgi:hypothetical protein
MGIDQGKIRASHNTFTEPLKAHSRSDNESLPSSINAKMWAMPKPTVVGELGERNEEGTSKNWNHHGTRVGSYRVIW